MNKIILSLLCTGYLNAMDKTSSFEQTIIRKFFLTCAKHGRKSNEILPIYTKLNTPSEQDLQQFNAMYELVQTGYAVIKSTEKELVTQITDNPPSN